MDGGTTAADCKPSVPQESEKAPNKGPPGRAAGEIVVEHTDVRRAKNIWQEKLDVAMARREQEQILAELQQLRNLERERERATSQFLKKEGYYFDSRDRQEKTDEMLAKQLAEEQERQLQQEEEDSALAAAIAALGVDGDEPEETAPKPPAPQKLCHQSLSHRFSGKSCERKNDPQHQQTKDHQPSSTAPDTAAQTRSVEEGKYKNSVARRLFSGKRLGN